MSVLACYMVVFFALPVKFLGAFHCFNNKKLKKQMLICISHHTETYKLVFSL